MITQNIEFALELLQKNEIVAIPTETVYGLAGNAYSEIAIQKIFEAKKRPTYDPLIVHTYSLENAKDFVTYIPDIFYELAKIFSPGALTFLLPKKKIIPDIVTSNLKTVAVRIPNHALTLSLLQKLDFPLAAPSANPFGYISPTTAQHVENQLGDKIPLILDGGAAEIGVESTIIGEKNGQITIFRYGGISKEDLEAWTGQTIHAQISNSNPTAPGQLESHYAPKKKLYLLKKNQINIQEKEIEIKNIGVFPIDKVGFLGFNEWLVNLPIKNQILLAENGDLKLAAQKLFAAMRELDTKDIEIIITLGVPSQHLGMAINDRLQRASFYKD
ncbi:MAG: threonylcarbamoyl-AMP synthase [Bacteroidetes bacterium]|nr:MAG: threonylcarbamoyl-AMP synthase [Bacteroidota bacterium]TAG93615.1 MAG: threonylcarbamoyl-AMP synthase [Bacteroidota bacterium]